MEPVPGFDDEQNALDYSFFCNEAMKAFSFITTAELVYFTPELTSTPQDGVSASNNLSCEGPIPGFGFGCRALGSSNQITNNADIPGQLITDKAPCPAFKGQESPRFWVTATTTQFTATGTAYTTSSEPYRLKNSIECPKPKPKPNGSRGGGNGGNKGGRR